MDQFLEINNLKKLTQKEINNLNRPISIKKLNQALINLQKRQNQFQMGSQ